ncbi:MAG: hypothetical protein H0X05_05570 [Actinobacteria bacterium]|nr:hypothetical protein [Actinomycetota bacterium]
MRDRRRGHLGQHARPTRGDGRLIIGGATLTVLGTSRSQVEQRCKARSENTSVRYRRFGATRTTLCAVVMRCSATRQIADSGAPIDA